MRNHEDAQPEIKELAQAMLAAMEASDPVYRHVHLPYITDGEEREYIKGLRTLEDLYKISTARCARISYLTHDGLTPSVESDIKLHDRLVSSRPIHASPTEHQAEAAVLEEDDGKFFKNLRSWKPYRIQVELNLNKE